MKHTNPASERSRWLLVLPVFALLIYALWIVTYPVFDYDLYWHLANGREMLASGQPVQRELFSFTHPGEPFPHLNHAWLAQGIFYLLWQAGGGHALLALKLLVTCIVALLVYNAARDWQAPPVAAALLSAWAILVGWFRFIERPELFSLLGIALLGWIIAGHLNSRRHTLWLAAIPPLLIVWDCLHGAVYGFALLSIVIVAENLKSKLCIPQIGMSKLTREQLRALNITFVASVITSMLHPYGLSSYLGFLDVATGQAAYDAGYTKVMEFQSPGWDHFKPFYFMLGAGIIAFVLNARNTNLTHILLFVAFGLLAIQFSRTTGVFALVAAPFIAATISNLLERWNIRSHRLPIKHLLAGLTALALLGYGIKVKHFEAESPQTFGLRVDDRFLPSGSVGFIKDHGIKGNLYNTGHFGGYLAFYLSPERPIFQYNLPMIFGDTYRYTEMPNELARWNITYAVVGEAQELNLLFPRTTWARIYREGAAVLVLRRTPENSAMIDRYELRYFHPLMDERQFSQAFSNPFASSRLVLEMADYLTYRQDALWSERLKYTLAARPDLILDKTLAPVLERANTRQRELARK